MSEEIAQPGQVPESAPVTPVIPAAAQAAPAKAYSEEDVSALRKEAAAYRVQLREAQAAIERMQTNSVDSKALSEQLAQLQTDLATKAAEAEAAQKFAQVTRLAVKVGVDPELIAMLDLSKIDLSDDKKASEQLAKFAGAGRGAQVKPGAINSSGDTDAELRAMFFGPGARKATIFGG